MIGRRRFLGAAGGLMLLAANRAKAGNADVPGSKGLSDAMAALERRSGGRLGVAVLDPGSGQHYDWRGGGRPMCSAYNSLAAAILKE